jgi:hypothetical protein
MGMQSKVANLELGLVGEVLVDVMKELVPLSNGELSTAESNRAILMHLCRAPADVHLLLRPPSSRNMAGGTKG